MDVFFKVLKIPFLKKSSGRFRLVMKGVSWSRKHKKSKLEIQKLIIMRRSFKLQIRGFKLRMWWSLFLTCLIWGVFWILHFQLKWQFFRKLLRCNHFRRQGLASHTPKWVAPRECLVCPKTQRGQGNVDSTRIVYTNLPLSECHELCAKQP